MAKYRRFLDPVRGLPRFDAILEQSRARTEAFRAAAGLPLSGASPDAQ